ncbi:MAG: YjjG family noncanonical pyrimidine nucleotidase [Anaerolineales bacterium]|nr:YjjG family noncanonical pyrimidine nucleotidase [Anaerolineales bacterium]
MQYDWLLFDADSTLFDYQAGARCALEATFREKDQPFGLATLARFHRINDHFWKKFEQGLVDMEGLKTQRFTALLNELGLPGDPCTWNERYMDHLSEQAILIDGAEELVRTLSRSYRMAILTNGVSRVQRGRLGRSSIEACFDALVISEEVGATKPNRAYFEAAFRMIGNPPRERALMIGDSLSSDVRGAVDFGVAICWYNPQGVPPDPDLTVTYEIRTLSELHSIL